MSVTKRRRDLLKVAQAVNPEAVIEYTGGTQLRIILTGPLGTRKVHCAMTPGDHRDMKNIKRDIFSAARAVGTLAPREVRSPVNDN